MCVLSCSKGPAAANIYAKKNEKVYAQLCVDWSFDGLYFQIENQPWITISLGKKQSKNEIDHIYTDEMKNIFKSLCFYALNNLTGYSAISDEALIEVRKKLDLFV